MILLLFLIIISINPLHRKYLYNYGNKLYDYKLYDIFHHPKYNLKKLSCFNDIFTTILFFFFYNTNYN